jgi:hypothetical protein
MPERAPVQKGVDGPAGTISWAEHLRVWEAYARRYRNGQTAERIAERGGFGHGEILDLTGGLARTFVRYSPHQPTEPDHEIQGEQS